MRTSIIAALVMALWLGGGGAVMAEELRMPAELTYQGQPVEPYCFTDIDGAGETVTLTDCGPENVVHSWHAAKGAICYESKPEEGAGKSFASYCYLGQYRNAAVLLVTDGGHDGWQGVSLVSYRRRDTESASLAWLVKGGEGEGSVADASVKDGHLTYSQHIGAWDFLNLAHDNPHGLQDMKDLGGNDLRMIDFGLANYADSSLASVDLDSRALSQDKPGVTQRYRYQSCFNRVFNDYAKRGKTHLMPDELKQFTGQFNTLCMEEKKAARAE